MSQGVYKKAGYYTFTITATNLVTKLSDTIKLTIEREIEEIKIKTNLTNNEGEIHEQFTMKLYAPDDCFAYYDTDMGNKAGIKKPQFVYYYADYGIYNIKSKAYNNVSKVFDEAVITIHKPVILLGTLSM